MATAQEGAYDSEDGYYHKYEMENEICSLDSPGCTADAVWSGLRRYPAPGWDPSTEVTDGATTHIKFAGLPGGDVVHAVDETKMRVLNITKPGHVFSDGYVSRTVVVRNNAVYIRTVGEGVTSPGAYYGLTRAMRATLNMKVYKPGFNSLDNNVRKWISD
jgi:hypothetical protein